MAAQEQTVGDVVKTATEYLASKDVDQPRMACELLMARLLRCRRLELYVNFAQLMSEKHLDAMRRGTKRLAAGEPVQYILGAVEFMGRRIKVDKRALIPRPETELLVQAMLDDSAIWAVEHPLVLDVGTGSGCIAASLAASMPAAQLVAVDASAEAIELAAENVANLEVLERVTFGGPDLSEIAEPDSLDAVAANLPYVTTSECETLPKHIRDYEPRMALDGGVDGLDIVRELLPDIWMILKPGAKVFLEIGAGQGECVKSILEENGFGGVIVQPDTAGHDRVVIAEKKDF